MVPAVKLAKLSVIRVLEKDTVRPELMILNDRLDWLSAQSLSGSSIVVEGRGIRTTSVFWLAVQGPQASGDPVD